MKSDEVSNSNNYKIDSEIVLNMNNNKDVVENEISMGDTLSNISENESGKLFEVSNEV